MSQILTISRSTGVPTVEFHRDEIPSLIEGNDVLLKVLAAPINPLDILVIADLYPVKPNFKYNDEAIPGYDGIAEVLAVGTDVKTFSIGDLVVPSRFGIGTWRSHLVVNDSWLQKVRRPTDLAFASILRITIAPAYCLVEDMMSLKPGDSIILNAGTSAISQMVIQFAKRKGVTVISVVRDRDTAEFEKVEKALLKLGAAIVLSESELPRNDLVKTKRITLALDSVFGESGRNLVKALSSQGTYVQLGFLGGKGELSLGPSDLFGKQVTMKAFRGSSQVGIVRSAEEQRDLFDWLIELFNSGELQLPPLGVPKVAWRLVDEGSKDELLKAIRRGQGASMGQRKQIIVFD